MVTRSKEFGLKIKVLLAWIAVFMVFVAVLWAVRNLVGDFNRQPLSWSEIRFIWILPASILFFLGMVPSWIYWHQILTRFGIESRWKASFAGFFISQLGKYVPGKVMVLGIRMAILGKRSNLIQSDCHLPPPPPGQETDELSDFEREVLEEAESELPGQAVSLKLQGQEKADRRQKLALIAAASFMETIMFMAVGTVVGCLVGIYFFWGKLWLAGGCFLLGCGLVLPTLPPVFRWLAKIQPIGKLDATLEKVSCGWDWKAVGIAWLILPIGWFSIGCSLFLLINGIPNQQLLVSDLPRCICGASVSSVLGFVSLFPGGFGVREIVLYPILDQRFEHALVLAILFRLTSLVGELMASAASQVLLWTSGNKNENS